MDLPAQLRIRSACQRPAADHRLHAAVAAPTDADFPPPRVGFVPRPAATVVGCCHAGALQGGPGLPLPGDAEARRGDMAAPGWKQPQVVDGVGPRIDLA